ncbi:MAG: LD-carboxypeptidase, partial [Aeromonas salmonicida]
MTLLKPPGLKPGDTRGFFSPSSAATAWAPNRFARSKRFMEAQGFRLTAG